MKSMEKSFTDLSFHRKKRKTRRELLLDWMEELLP